MKALFAVLPLAAFAVCEARAFAFEDARKAYIANFTESPPSVQECGDFVFVIQEGIIDYDDPSGINRAVLKGQLEAIEKYVGRPSGGLASPFSPALTETLLPLAQFRMPECKSCKIDETRLSGKFRHVSAFEAEPLRKAREEAASGRPVTLSSAEWAELVAQKLKELPDAAAKDALWAALGAAVPLVSRLGGARWTVERADGVALCSAMSGWRGDETAKECNALLSLNPAFALARARLAGIAFAQGDFALALSRRLKAALAAPDPEGVSAAAERAAEASGSAAWREYAALYALAAEKSSLAAEGSAPVWRYLVNSGGHLEPPRAAAEDAKRAAELFREGRALFSQGRELERLTDLFRQSLEADPSVQERWRYFAAALRAAGRDADAAVAYAQALSMRGDDWVALADMAAVCRKLGFAELAKGCAWYVLAMSSDASPRAKAEKALAE